ncbi:MAG: hypothetical protein FJY85_02935 [Deltaproteobacteria bacterium]|nr:hypothetical protein [Deltaproteobacteria bacterium]
MRCEFTLGHYREILRSAIDAEYTIVGFHSEAVDREGRHTLYLRHDIDVCIEEALPMARVEAELGIPSTYFLIVDSPAYNILSADSVEMVGEIRRLGHWVGLHVDAAAVSTFGAERIEEWVEKLLSLYGDLLHLVRVVSFHRPSPEVLNRGFAGFVSAYESRFLQEIKYISESRGSWREACPCQAIRDGQFRAVQLLVHPVWWSASPRETLDVRLEHLLSARSKETRSYLAKNITPLRELLTGKASGDSR